MHRATQPTTLQSVLKLLYQPVPYLPEGSFLERGRCEQRRRQAMARIQKKAPQERKLRGSIKLIGKGKCEICGHHVEFDESTWIFGDIKDGTIAEMTLQETAHGYLAKRIVIVPA